MSSITFDVIARDRASNVMSKVGKSVDDSGKKLKKFGDKTIQVGKTMTVGLTAPIAALGVKSFQVFASFDKTMRQVGVQTKQSGAGMKELTDLALKMGKDTNFSAGQAADAMLELAKGGMTAAQIKGGVLQQTLTLAAAGSLSLGDAAGYVSNAMNTFGLEAKDAGAIAAALAGGANASTASVESLGMALGQVGPGAKQAGLSLNDTVAALAAFDNAGIKGSDAGTSLKTMLQRLVPQTDASAAAMRHLGIDFTNTDGSFKSITQIAGILHDKMGKLSDVQRTQALNTIFGSDASRAAAILMENGSKGISKYKKATEDLSAAQKMAKTNTEGAAGSIEQMQGSIETAEITLGKALAPTVTDVAKKISGLANAFSDLSPDAQKNVLIFGAIAAAIGPVIIGLGSLVKALGVLKVAMFGNPFTAVLTGLLLLGVALVTAYKTSETFRTHVNKAFYAVVDVGLNFSRSMIAVGKFVVQAFRLMTKIALDWAGTTLEAVARGMSWVPELGPKLKTASASFDKFRKDVDGSFSKAEDTLTGWDASLAKTQKIVKFKGDIVDLDHKIATAKKQLKDPNLTKERKAKLTANIASLVASKREAQRQINSLRGKTVYLDVYRRTFTQGGEPKHVPGNSGSGRMATGGMVRGPGTGTSDTAGMFALSNGEFVLNSRATARLGAPLLNALNSGSLGLGSLSGSSGSAAGTQPIEVHFHGPVGNQRELYDWLVKSFNDLSRQGRVSPATLRR